MNPYAFARTGPRCLMVTALMISIAAFGQEKEPVERPSRSSIEERVLGSPQYAILNINNVTTWMRYDGHSNHSPAYDDGIYFPRGTGSVIYQDNVVWGGKAFVNAGFTTPAPRQLIRVGGGTYSVGTRGGKVLDPSLGPATGTGVEDPNAADTRIWRIRRDYFTMPEAELRREAASVNEINEMSVTETQRSAVAEQYDTDWTQWPVHKGAPYIERNGIAGYQPPPAFDAAFTVDSLISGRYDEPGVAGADPDQPADQVIWTVYNDLRTVTAQSFVGSESMGLEVQKTVWGYKRSDELGNLYFSRYRIINKGGVDVDAAAGDQFGAFWIDSMYVCQWSDPDVGAAGDDLIGCDTTVSLGYAFNATNVDANYQAFNLTPPAVGYVIVAGPLVDAPGDAGIFDLRRVGGKKNLAMTSFAYFSAGSPYQDPPSGYSNYLSGTGRWWKMLRGFAPLGDLNTSDNSYAHPPGMAISRFPFSGDPVTQNGFLDGLATAYSFAAGDRRILLNSGPFSMAPDDTIEFVVATVAGIGADRLSSVVAMRSIARLTDFLYRNLLAQSPPAISVTTEFPVGQSPQVRLVATCSPPFPIAVEARGRRADGSLLFSVSLFDDGAHDDGVSGDGVFGAASSVPAGVSPLSSLVVAWEYAGGMRDSSVQEVRVSLLPPPTISASIVSDNFNNDGVANRGENIRIGLAFLPVQVTLDSVIVKTLSGSPDEIIVEKVDGVGGLSRPYDPMDPMSFLSVDVPAWYAESTLVVPVQITDRARNIWHSELRISVEVKSFQVEVSPVTKVQGLVAGLFGILRVDPTAIKNHTYQIEGFYDPALQKAFITLKDLNEGANILLDKHEIPDSLGHNMPVIDGFKIVQGTVVSGRRGLIPNAWAWTPTAGRFMTGSNTDGTSGFGFEEFSGAWGAETPQHFFQWGDNRVSPTSLYGVRIVFSAHGVSAETSPFPSGLNGGELFDRTDDDTASYAYRYLRGASAVAAQPHFAAWIVNAQSGYRYQDYRISAPLSAYNTDVNPPARLAIGFLENNVANGLVDGYYWPAPLSAVPGGNNTTGSGPREWLFILNHSYTGSTPAAMLQSDIYVDPAIQTIYWGTWNRRNLNPWPAGNSFTLTPYREISSSDVWTFNPSLTGVEEKEPTVPGSFVLAQNYPNPFNPSTTIGYSLPTDATVSLRVYNVLGQLVQTIVQAEQSAGVREVTWNADRYPSGLYICRLDARGTDGSNFTQARKMMLVR